MLFSMHYFNFEVYNFFNDGCVLGLDIFIAGITRCIE